MSERDDIFGPERPSGSFAAGPAARGQESAPESGQENARSKHGFTALFVRRPVLAAVLNTLMVVAGLAALVGIEVRELPDVDQPVITVRTEYDGASAQTMDQEVTDVIEGAVARVSGLKSISSESQFGSSRVTLEFSDSVDLAVAANDVRDALGRVTNQLRRCRRAAHHQGGFRQPADHAARRDVLDALDGRSDAAGRQ